MDYQRKLAGYVKTLRKKTGFSQNAFAIECELTSSMMSKFEGGKSKMLMSSLTKIARYFGKTLGEFLVDFEKDCGYTVEDAEESDD